MTGRHMLLRLNAALLFAVCSVARATDTVVFRRLGDEARRLERAKLLRDTSAA